ncbi:FecCD family ABC transporter permease [Methylobacterium oryzisoli]|uniref:FecCD family ABC transporter permease n=1 Tax=Methylobacterium oryzisoli TaxID=3385502 RepID=UPI00389237E3
MAEAAPLAQAALPRRRTGLLLFPALVLLVAAAALVSLAAGAIAIPPARVAEVLWRGAADPALARDAFVVLNIRLPRTLLGLLVGAALAVSGALMQGLFRNPLADPGLVGVSAGAGLAAACVVVAGDRLLAILGLPGPVPFLALPVGAFLGGLATTALLYALATSGGRTSVATLLLAGLALGALAGALTGILIYLSDDRQLRDLTFWSLGSLAGATWAKVWASAPAILPVLIGVPFLGRGLNALVLGEAEAFHLGVPVQVLKRAAIVLVAAAVGASVAAAGVIGFVGLVVPHGLRLLVGPEHRRLLPASALLGAALLVLADVAARLVASPAELPIGIVTALIGAPFFLWLLMGRARVLDA